MRRTSDRVHIHPVAILPIPRSPPRPTILRCDRYVVIRLHCRGIVPWSAAVPWVVRIQPSLEDNGDAWTATTLDVGDGQTIRGVLPEGSGRIWPQTVPAEVYGTILKRTWYKGTAQQEVLLRHNTTGHHQELPYASEEHEA